MNIKEAKEEIKNTVQAYLSKREDGSYRIEKERQRPILLMGPPGIGKTAVMEQAARECGISLVAYTITHHTRQSAVGLPYIVSRVYQGNEYSVTEYTMSEIIASVYEQIEKSGISEGILFLDEINCVSETLAPAMLQFLQKKTFGTHAVPSGWLITAAGNPPEYNKSVREFDVVTLDRVKYIRIEADYGVWKDYAYEQKIHGAVTSYLEMKKEAFYKIETGLEGKRFVTARGWEDLSEILTVYESLSIPLTAEIIQEYLQHPQTARDFAAYLELYHKYQKEYEIPVILAGGPGGDEKGQLVLKLQNAGFDERLSIVSLLLAGLTAEFSRVSDKETVVEKLFEALSEWKGSMEQAKNAEEFAAKLSSILERRIRTAQKRKESGLSSAEEIRLEHMVILSLERYCREAVQEREVSAAFARVKRAFEEETAERLSLIAETAWKLENAFDFMEEVFAEGTELVIFLTELTAGPYSMRFIRDHGCKRYYAYHKTLLFDETRQEIMKELRAEKERIACNPFPDSV